MSDYATPITQVAASQANKEVTVNGLIASAAPSMLFARLPETSVGLTWGVQGGRFNGTLVANSTVALTASSTNYVVIHRTTLAASVSTSNTNWNNTTTYGRSYMVTAGASSATDWEDNRAGADGILTPLASSGGGLLAANNLSDVASAATSRTNLGLVAVASSGSAADLTSGTLPAARMPALTGDITTSAGAVATTLATVNSNVGSFGDGTHVTALTVNAKGLITAASAVLITGGSPSGSAGGDLAGTYPNPTVKTSVSLTTPTLGVAAATSINKVALTAPATGSTLTIADGKTLTASNSLTLAGTDSTTMTFPPASASIGYLNIPQNSQSTAYTTVLGDSGKHLLHPAADTTARTFTIDSNANVAYPIGTAITFINQNAGGMVTIAITSDTMRLAGAGTTGSRTLAANGVATAVKITSTEWIISGTGLT